MPYNSYPYFLMEGNFSPPLTHLRSLLLSFFSAIYRMSSIALVFSIYLFTLWSPQWMVLITRK